jgi:hypothetical protein
MLIIEIEVGYVALVSVYPVLLGERSQRSSRWRGFECPDQGNAALAEPVPWETLTLLFLLS